MPRIQLDDLELYYQIKGTGTEPVLALHPSTVNGTMFTWAIPRHDQYRVILPDQRAHGKSNNPAPDLNMHRLVKDMVNLMDALEIEQFHGIGYSLGGAVLLGLCQAIPQRLKSLVIIGASHVAPSEAQQTAIAGAPETRQGLIAEVMHPTKGTRSGWTVKRSVFAEIKGRVGVIVGDRDPVVEIEAAIDLYRAFPNAELITVPNCGHFGYHTSPLVKLYLQAFYEELAK